MNMVNLWLGRSKAPLNPQGENTIAQHRLAKVVE
jgi:hypothetical protein